MQTDFSIRPLTQQDEPFLWEMLYHAIHVPEGQSAPPRSILDEPYIAHYVSQWAQKPGDLGFAVLDQATGKPVGAAWLRVFNQEHPGYGYVDDETPELSIAMLPEYRGQGLGSCLLNALLNEAGQKFASVSLSVSPGNAAERLYQKLGFTVVCEDASSRTMLKRLK